MELQKGPLEGNKGFGRWTAISSDAVRRVHVGGVQTSQSLNLDGLSQQRLSTACRCNSSTTTTAERSPKYPVTHVAVIWVEPQLTKHWFYRPCTYCRFVNTPPQCKSQCIGDVCPRPIEHDRNPDHGQRSPALVGRDGDVNKAPIVANDHQHLLEAKETLLKYRSWLTITSTCWKQRYFTKTPII